MTERHRDFHAFEWQGEILILNIRVQPRVSRDRYEGIQGDHVHVRISAPPTDGFANAYLMDFLSDVFDVPKSPILLISGSTNRNKRVRIDRPRKLRTILCDLGITRRTHPAFGRTKRCVPKCLPN